MRGVAVCASLVIVVAIDLVAASSPAETPTVSATNDATDLTGHQASRTQRAEWTTGAKAPSSQSAADASATSASSPGDGATSKPSAPPSSTPPSDQGESTANRNAPGAGAPTGPLGLPGNWRLKFDDEFSGKTLNVDKWRPNWLGAHNNEVTKPFNEHELSCYDPSQVRVKDGSVGLQAVKDSCPASNGKVYDYRSGIIQSSADYWFTYGFAEARMYLPPSTDPTTAALGSCGPNWGAFWLSGVRWPKDGEIDVMECLGDDNVTWNYHWAGPAATGRPKEWDGKMPGEGGWHVFGVDWQPDSLTFYYDGKAVGRTDRGITHSPHYLIANLSISGTKIKVPQTAKVDYVRVWRRR